MKYRIGLDIGIASVGGCAMECDENGEPVRILDLSVRIFDKAEDPQTGASLALPRRTARGMRRRLRRRAHRLERVRRLCLKQFGEDVLQRAEGNKEDIFRLRFAGLSETLRDEELTRVLIYFAKHRGFRSNRKSEGKDKNTDAGKMLKAVRENEAYMRGKGYATVGEMLYRDPKYFEIVEGRKIYHTRNGDGDYGKAFAREDIRREAALILARQTEGRLVDRAFAEKYLGIFSSQRSFDEGPASPSPYRLEGYDIGNCIFEQTEKRAPKASYTFEYGTALQKINNLKVIDGGTERFLTAEEREKLYAAAREKKEYDFLQVKKLLSLPSEASFNLVTYSSAKAGKKGKKGETEKAVKTPEEIEKKTKLFKMYKSYAIRACLSEEKRKNISLLDEIARILSLYKSDERRLAAFAASEKCAALTEAEKSALLEEECSQFGSISIKAMTEIIRSLEKGKKYNEACAEAGYDFRAHGRSPEEKYPRLRGKEVREFIEGINVPVVRRAVAQSVKVLNAYLDKYGAPCGVNIELARELAKNFDERNKILRENKSREENYQSELEKLQNEFHLKMPKGTDVLKLRLYEEQRGKCPYSGKPIDSTRLFESNYVQIDHILPYSRSFDDSYNNKVLVLSEENQNKKNRTPFEYFGADAARWSNFEVFVKSTYDGNRKKRDNLLRQSFTEDNEKEWKERALNDTKYISRVVYNLVNDYLLLDPIEGKKKQVCAVNGKITAYLRKFWGLQKDRSAGDKHHAQDAAVIACVTDGVIQKVTKFNQIKELLKIRKGSTIKGFSAQWDEASRRHVFIDADGVVLAEDEYDERNGYHKQPYEGFVKELQFRLMENPQAFIQPHLSLLQSLGYSDEEIDGIRPVFVSRMPSRKAKGAIHKETIRSARSLAEGVTSSKTPLTQLKLTKDKTAILGYNEKAKRDDRLLYDALLTRLQAADGKAEKAFAEPFYKPTKDGRQGPLVRKVWIDSAFNAGVVLENGKSVADNGGMVRIDVFRKDGKYFCVPVYTKDIYAKHLPNRAITAGKKYADWDKIDGTFEFLFALFANDLIYVKAKKPFNLTPLNKEEKQQVSMSEGFFYYKGINIATGAATIITHDHSYETELGLKTLLRLEKYTVDVLGEKYPVRKEKRLNTEWDT